MKKKETIQLTRASSTTPFQAPEDPFQMTDQTEGPTRVRPSWHPPIMEEGKKDRRKEREGDEEEEEEVVEEKDKTVI